MTGQATASRPAASRALPAALLLVAFAAGAASSIPVECRASEARAARAMAAAVAVALDMLATEHVAAVLQPRPIADVAPGTAASRVRPVDAPAHPTRHLGERLLDLPPPARV